MGIKSQPGSYGKTEAAATGAPAVSAGPAADDRPPLTPGRRWLALGMLVGVLAALAWLGLNNPLEHSFLPRCPTEQYAGVYCPGCGSTRATHHLLQGRPGVAMTYNPLLVVVGTPLILFTLASLGYRAATGRQPRRWVPPAWVGWLTLAVTLVFMVTRNLPGDMFEGLRPPPVEVDRARVMGDEAG